jgi:hypothetical protein
MGSQHVFASALTLLAILPVDQPTRTTPAAAKTQLIRAQASLGTCEDIAGTLMGTMMELAKDALKDRQTSREEAHASQEVELKNKAAKLQNANKQIERQLDEAAQKAESLMDAAEGELRAGIRSGFTSSGPDSFALLANHLRSVETMARGLKSRAPAPGTPTQAGPDLQRALQRFEKLKTRIAATSKQVDKEIKKQ